MASKNIREAFPVLAKANDGVSLLIVAKGIKRSGTASKEQSRRRWAYPFPNESPSRRLSGARKGFLHRSHNKTRGAQLAFLRVAL